MSREKPRRQSCEHLVSLQFKASNLESAYPINRVPFLLCDKHLLSSRRSRCITFGFLAQQLQELIRMILDHLSKLRVPGANLLEDRLQHLRLSLDDLAELLELRIIAKKVEIAGASRSCGSPSRTTKTCKACSGGTRFSATPSTTTSGSSTAGLGPLSCFEQIDWLISRVAARVCWCCRGCLSRLRRSSGGGLLSSTRWGS